MKVTILGCGGSEGVPSAVGNWGICDPSNPRNYRRRPAALVEIADADGIIRWILIDTPPELREQLAMLAPERIDAVLLTHGHADHLHGLDDLRPFARRAGGLIPVLGDQFVIDEVEERFGYTTPSEARGVYRPIIAPQVVRDVFEVCGITVNSFTQDHGFGPSTGYRIGGLGYTIDVVRLSEAAFGILAGIDVWIVDCQQIEPHPSHSHLEQTIGWIDRVKPRRAILTHMGPRLDYAALCEKLPSGVEPGFDGMCLELSDIGRRMDP